MPETVELPLVLIEQDNRRLSDVLAKNKQRADNLLLIADVQLKWAETSDFKEATFETLEAVFKPIVEFETKVAASAKEIEEERRPLTAKLNEIISSFTAPEKIFEGVKARIKAVRNRYEVEKRRREQAAKDDAAAELKKKQDLIQQQLVFKNKITDGFTAALSRDVLKMTAAYNSKTAAELPAYAAQLGKWVPILSETEYAQIVDKSCEFGNVDIVRAVAKHLQPMFTQMWADTFKQKRDYLVDLVVSRIIALKSPSFDPKQSDIEKYAINLEIAAQGSDVKDIQAALADADNLEAHFSSVAVPTVEKSKGTVIKRKYVINKHADLLKIIQLYIKNEMPALTIEELVKKLSFMITAANAKMNDKKNPETIDGIETVEDINTRRAG